MLTSLLTSAVCFGVEVAAVDAITSRIERSRRRKAINKAKRKSYTKGKVAGWQDGFSDGRRFEKEEAAAK